MNKSWRFRHHESWTLQLLNMLGVWRIENGPLTILCLKREKLKNFFERKLRFEELSSTTELLFWQSDWYLETLTKVSVHCESVSVRLHKQSRSQHFCIESSNPVSNLPSRNNEGSMLTGLADKMGELEIRIKSTVLYYWKAWDSEYYMLLASVWDFANSCIV